jgi:hypothetical protein
MTRLFSAICFKKDKPSWLPQGSSVASCTEDGPIKLVRGSVSDPVSGSVSVIRIRIQEGKKDPPIKIEKIKNSYVLKCWMFSFGG